MGDLPFDAIAEVLARLPTKSLMRFKCISHPWNNLISDPWFLNFRNHYYKKRSLGILYVKCSQNGECKFHFTVTDTEGNLIKEFSLPAVNNSCGRLGHYWVYPSCLDLACFHTFDGQIYLCNPNTQQILPLPYNGQFPRRLECLGFGYSSTTHEYKVVTLFLENPVHTFFYDQYGIIDDISCQIYSLGEFGALLPNHELSWKTIAEKCPHPVKGSAACVDEVLHWLPCRGYHDARVAMVSLDLNAEKFTTMPISQQWLDIHVRLEYTSVREFAGKLCLVYSSSLEGNTIRFGDKFIGIWMVKDYNEGTWEKWLHINLDDLENPTTTYTIRYINVAAGFFMENEEELLLQTFDDEGSRLNFYNTQTNSFRNIYECSSSNNKSIIAHCCLCSLESTRSWAGQWLT